MMPKIKRKLKKIENDEQFIKRKSSQARSSWRTRAKKNESDLDSIPTTTEIAEFIKACGFKCYISKGDLNKSTLELDHKTPISRGGTFKLDNVGLTSRYYNQVKGSMTLKEFNGLLKLVSKWEDKGKDLFARLLSSNRRYIKK